MVRDRTPGRRDLGDVRVIEGGQRLGFAHEAIEAVGVVLERGRENLDGDLALQLGIAGAIHLAHSARPEGRGDLVRAEACTWRESHLVPRKRDDLHKSRSAAPGSQGATTEDIGHM